MSGFSAYARFPGRDEAARPRLGPRRPAGQVGRADYYDCALTVLVESGSDGLTAAKLCDRLRVTKGSFYHHFSGMDDFVENFAGHRERALVNLLTQVAAEPDPLTRLELATNAALLLPHEAERAIRAWSHNHEALGRSQRRIDQAAVSHITAVVASFVDDAECSALIGRQVVSMFIGLQELDSPTDRVGLARAMGYFAEITCGVTAKVTVDQHAAHVEYRRKDNQNESDGRARGLGI